ncbi:hypothetical protein MRX96_003598 [Rhipicephalus microplus]
MAFVLECFKALMRRLGRKSVVAELQQGNSIFVEQRPLHAVQSSAKTPIALARGLLSSIQQTCPSDVLNEGPEDERDEKASGPTAASSRCWH